MTDSVPTKIPMSFFAKLISSCVAPTRLLFLPRCRDLNCPLLNRMRFLWKALSIACQGPSGWQHKYLMHQPLLPVVVCANLLRVRSEQHPDHYRKCWTVLCLTVPGAQRLLLDVTPLIIVLWVWPFTVRSYPPHHLLIQPINQLKADIHCSSLVYQANEFAVEGYQLGESTLTTPDHFLVLMLGSDFQEQLFHHLLVEMRLTAGSSFLPCLKVLLNLGIFFFPLLSQVQLSLYCKFLLCTSWKQKFNCKGGIDMPVTNKIFFWRLMDFTGTYK